jgi:hypothetical protein
MLLGAYVVILKRCSRVPTHKDSPRVTSVIGETLTLVG